MDIDAEGSWFVTLAMLAVICWQLWLAFREDDDTARKTDHAEHKAAVIPFLFQFYYRLESSGPVSRPDAIDTPDEIADAIRQLHSGNPDFVISRFMRDLPRTYETIVLAYADGDLERLGNLLGDAVLSDFAAAIAARGPQGGRTETQLVWLDEPRLIAAHADGGVVELSVRLDAEWIRSTTFEDEGRPTRIAYLKTEDEWIFAKAVTSRSRQWQLVATNLPSGMSADAPDAKPQPAGCAAALS